MTLKNTNTSALLEKSYECGSGAGMRHIGFYMDGISLTVDGSKDGTKSTPEVNLRLTLKNNGSLEIEANMETGNE